MALESIAAVLHRRCKMETALDRARQQLATPRDRGLLHRLVSGVMRHFFTLEADWSRFVRAKPSPLAQAALLLGTLQLRHLKVADHAAIHTTVEAIKRREPEHTAMVNAVLRKVRGSKPPQRFKPYQRANLPRWLYRRWRDAFGAETVAEIARHAAKVPPLAVAALGARDSLLAAWRKAGIDARPGAAPQAILLPSDTEITALPGWSEGRCTVIDQSAQWAALALPESDGLCLDLCSAPGGKYALLHPRMGTTVALDVAARRLPRWRHNITRLGIERAPMVQADALHPPFPHGIADRIMLDAPCTASGLLRRHPDVKFLHDEAQIARLAEQQQALLQQALRLLKPGGILAYAVCSIHPEENAQVVRPVLDRHPEVHPYPLPEHLLPHAVTAGMARIFPSEACDGFFIALLQKDQT